MPLQVLTRPKRYLCLEGNLRFCLQQLSLEVLTRGLLVASVVYPSVLNRIIVTVGVIVEMATDIGTVNYFPQH